jgi:hypothetical protein
MLIWTGLTLLVLGVVVWLYGNRLWLLGAGAGALLGIGLLRLFPGMADGVGGFLLVVGLAIAVGVLGFLGKAFSKMIALIVGFIAGGGIALGLIDSLGLSLGFWNWILALIAGGIGALLFARFLDWGLIIFAALVGSALIVRGVGGLLPSLTGALGGVAILALTALGIYYHYRKQAPGSAAQPAGSG